MTVRLLLIVSSLLLLLACNRNTKEVYHCGDKAIIESEDNDYLETIYSSDGQPMDPASTIIFPLRIATVINPRTPVGIYPPDVDSAIVELNHAFRASGIQFELKEVVSISEAIHIEDITRNNYRQYKDWSLEHDRSDRITVYLFDDNQDYCTRNGETLSCRRTHGFSFILHPNYLNIVLTKQDLINKKVLAHEMGHFFGLHHTFRVTTEKETIQRTNCASTGDYLCSTPADPGEAYEVYVDYTNCEMFGLKDAYGNEYKPMINNYMSYYKPCYLKEFEFTPEQQAVMRQAAESDRRRALASNYFN